MTTQEIGAVIQFCRCKMAEYPNVGHAYKHECPAILAVIIGLKFTGTVPTFVL